MIIFPDRQVEWSVNNKHENKIICPTKQMEKFANSNHANKENAKIYYSKR